MNPDGRLDQLKQSVRPLNWERSFSACSPVPERPSSTRFVSNETLSGPLRGFYRGCDGKHAGKHETPGLAMANRAHWYYDHPPACTCVKCQEGRSGGTPPAGGGRGKIWALILIVALGGGVWLARDNVATIISDLQPSSQARPAPTSTLPFPRPTVSPAEDSTPTSTSNAASSYITEHGKILPLIDAAALEKELVAFINQERAAGGLERLVRAPSLDYPAIQHSRVMAQNQVRAVPPSLDTACGATATLVIESPQVTQFSYRGPLAAPTDVTPTDYDKTAEEAAAGVVGYTLENSQEPEASYIDDPHFRFVGVGAVQAPDDLGHRIFWITLYLADCSAGD